MSRIDFGLIAHDNVISRMKEEGKIMYGRALAMNSRNGGNRKEFSGYREGNYVASQRAQIDTGMSEIPGDSVYRNPALELALSFAVKNDDKKLIKALARIDKYTKAAYEANYTAAELSLRFYESSQRKAEYIKSEKETLAFLERYSKYTNSELFKLKKSKVEQLSGYVSDEEKTRLTYEIKLIEELIKNSKRKRKKMIIAKEKEIREIVESTVRNKSVKNRYLRYKSSARKNSQKLVGEKFDMAREIIREMRSAVYSEFYVDGEYGKRERLEVPIFKIHDNILKSVEKELTEKYYSNSNAKKR